MAPARSAAEEITRVDARLRADLGAARARPDQGRRARVLGALERGARTRPKGAGGGLAPLALVAGVVALGLALRSGAQTAVDVHGSSVPSAAAARPARPPEPVRALGRLVPERGLRLDLDEPLRDESRRLAADAARVVDALTARMPGPLRHALRRGATR